MFVKEHQIGEKITIVKLIRGKELGLHDGYRYHKMRANVDGSVNWRCHLSPGCDGTMLSLDDKFVKRKIHNCKQDYLENDKIKLDYKWKLKIGSNVPTVGVLEKMAKEYEAARARASAREANIQTKH